MIGYIQPVRDTQQERSKWPNVLARIRSYGGDSCEGKLTSEQISGVRGE